MSEFVIKTPGEDSNCTQRITVTTDGEHITLSDTEYGSQYITIPLDKWQELKDAIDATLAAKKVKPIPSWQERVETDPEFAKEMQFYGVEALCSKDRGYRLEYYDRKYWLIVLKFDTETKDKHCFDTADELKSEFLKLKHLNTNRDFDADFDDFMIGVNDIKKCYGIGGGDE